ncbi:MAG: PadR family transcriptional regulator [Gemmatimonadetes bacterium]|nr:PadR family transcriptional regulator [Gemmatimonadota bacterium]
MGQATTQDQPLTPAVFHVLLALADGPLHGYAVMKRAEEHSGLGMGPGTIYGSLQRLEEAGWVEVSSADGDARRTRRFSLTSDGREALRAEAARLSRLAHLVEGKDLVPSPASGG